MSSRRLIDHVGILVVDIEASIVEWERLTGYRFSPIGRYRSSNYVDQSNRSPHFHDARIAFSREGPPFIELLEATGEGTHSTANLGVHHVAFADIADLEAERDRVRALGLEVEGYDANDEGDWLLFFAQRDNVRLELVSPKDHPNVMDDGSPMWRNPSTGRFDLWGPDEPGGSSLTT